MKTTGLLIQLHLSSLHVIASRKGVAIRRSHCEGAARGNLTSSLAPLGTRLRRFTSRNNNRFNAPPLDKQKGIALVIALVMLLVLTLVGLSAVSMTNFETNISGNQRVYNLAFYTADGGIENFRGRVSGGEFIYSAVSAGSYQVTVGGNACNVSYDKWPRKDAEGDFTVFKITSEGRVPFPSTGRVTIESIIEVLTTMQPGYN